MKIVLCSLVSAFWCVCGVAHDILSPRHASIARRLQLGKELMLIKGVEIKNFDLASLKQWHLPEEIVVKGRLFHLRTEFLPGVNVPDFFTTNQVMCIQLRERSQSNERYAIGNLYLARSVELAYRMGLGEEARKTCIDMPHYARSFRVEFRGEVMITSGFMRHRARNPQFTDQVTAVYRNLVCTVDAVKDGAEIALALIKACCPGCDAGPETGAGKGRTPKGANHVLAPQGAFRYNTQQVCTH